MEEEKDHAAPHPQYGAGKRMQATDKGAALRLAGWETLPPPPPPSSRRYAHHWRHEQDRDRHPSHGGGEGGEGEAEDVSPSWSTPPPLAQRLYLEQLAESSEGKRHRVHEREEEAGAAAAFGMAPAAKDENRLSGNHPISARQVDTASLWRSPPRGGFEVNPLDDLSTVRQRHIFDPLTTCYLDLRTNTFVFD